MSLRLGIVCYINTDHAYLKEISADKVLSGKFTYHGKLTGDYKFKLSQHNIDFITEGTVLWFIPKHEPSNGRAGYAYHIFYRFPAILTQRGGDNFAHFFFGTVSLSKDEERSELAWMTIDENEGIFKYQYFETIDLKSRLGKLDKIAIEDTVQTFVADTDDKQVVLAFREKLSGSPLFDSCFIKGIVNLVHGQQQGSLSDRFRARGNFETFLEPEGWKAERIFGKLNVELFNLLADDSSQATLRLKELLLENKGRSEALHGDLLAIIYERVKIKLPGVDLRNSQTVEEYANFLAFFKENEIETYDFAQLIGEKIGNIISSTPLPAIMYWSTKFPDFNWDEVKRQRLTTETEILPFLTLDIEIRNEKLIEFSFFFHGKMYDYLGEKKCTEGLEILQGIINANEVVLVGHNIRLFDIPHLIKAGIDFEGCELWDTLEFAALINPLADSYALDTQHNANADVLLTLRLFTEQLIYVSYFLEDFTSIIFSGVKKLIHQIAVLKLQVNDFQGDFFRQKATFELKEEIEKQLTVNEKKVIISPSSFFPYLRNIKGLDFFDKEQTIYNTVLDDEKIVQSLSQNTFLRTALERFFIVCQEEGYSPIYARLSPWLRNLLGQLIVDYKDLGKQLLATSESHLCVQDYAALQISDRNSAVWLFPAYCRQEFSQLLQILPVKEYEDIFDKYQLWMKFQGGQSYYRLSLSKDRLLLEDLKVEAPDYINNLWLEKNGLSEYSLWGNHTDLEDLFNSHFSEISAIELPDNKAVKLTVIKVNEGDLSRRFGFTRLNPETIYRSRYFLLQTQLLERLTGSATHASVYFIQNKEEIAALSAYLRSKGWYIPAKEAALSRQVELLQESSSYRKIIVIELSRFSELLTAAGHHLLSLIIDSIPVNRQWVMVADRKKILVDKDNEVSSTQEEVKASSSDVSATVLRHDSEGAFAYCKPTIEYYRTAVGAFNLLNEIYLADARVTDIPQGTTWRRMNVTPALSPEAWTREENLIQEYFPKIQADKEVDIDLDKCREAISTVFLSGHKFYDYQENYFPHIVKREDNMVVSLPTGGGKSILFQGPSLYRGSKTNRLSIVVTPLKALMKDQVENLWELNFWGSVESVSGDLSQAEVRDIYRRTAGGQILMLYITPERFRSRSFVTALENRIKADGNLEYCIFDEAHCISQWGNEFRPSFLNAAKYVRILQKNAAAFFPCLFFSATLSEKVFDDLKNMFS